MKLRRGHCWRLRCIHEIEFNDRWQLNSAAVAAYSIRDTGVVRTRPHPARDQARPKISNPPNLLIRSRDAPTHIAGVPGRSGQRWRSNRDPWNGCAAVRGQDCGQRSSRLGRWFRGGLQRSCTACRTIAEHAGDTDPHSTQTCLAGPGQLPGAPKGWPRAGKQFRRANGHIHLRSLRDTLGRVTQPADSGGHTEPVQAR